MRFTLCLLAVVLFGWLPTVADATGFAYDIELKGWIWSSNIGWISASCENTTNSCATVDYGVSITPTGAVTGYAWSPNIGWIKFGGLSSFPSGSSTTQVNARVTGTYPNFALEGWARACAGTTSGNCSTMVSRTDGWDGWISLRGSNYGVSLTSTGATADSYSWGSNVVGWLKWGGISGSVCRGYCGTSYNVNNDITINSLIAVPGTVVADENYNYDMTLSAQVAGIPDGTTINYTVNIDGVTTSVTGTVTGTDSDTVTLDIEITDVPFIATDITLEVDTLTPGRVAETNENNNSRSLSLDLSPPPPSIVLEVVGGRNVVARGATVELDWSVLSYENHTCTMGGPGLNESRTVSGTPTAPAAIGSLATTLSTASTSQRFRVDSLQSSGTFVLRCGSEEESVSVRLVPTFQEI